MPDLTALRPLLGDPRQYASVRGITLDDGAERGQRALLFSTGGGLDFMVLTDRQMDIGTLSLAGRQLGWQSSAGFVAPQLLSAEGDSATGASDSVMACSVFLRRARNAIAVRSNVISSAFSIWAKRASDSSSLRCTRAAIMASLLSKKW